MAYFYRIERSYSINCRCKSNNHPSSLRCVRKMDHHCPWINNCVGENNQKFFVLFTFYIAIISLHVIALVAILFIDCISIASDARSSRGRSSGQLFKDVQHHGVHGFFRRRPASALGVNETLDGSDADRDPVCGAFSRPLYVVLVILLVFEALLFSIFTAVMCLSQVTVILEMRRRILPTFAIQT